MSGMDIALAVVTVVLALALGIMVFFQDRTFAQNRLFLLMCISTGVWVTSNFLTNHNYGYPLEINEIANKIAYASGFLVVVFGLLFSYKFGERQHVTLAETIGIYVVSVAVIVLSFSDYIAGKVLLVDGEVRFENGTLLGVYALCFIMLVTLVAYNLVWAIRHGSERKKGQAVVILAAFVISALTGLMLNVILPLMSLSWDSSRFGPIAIALLVATVAYAIVRHKLFDIKLAVVRSVAYGSSVVALALVYYLLVYATSVLFFGGQMSPTVSMSPANIAIALLLAFLFQPIKGFFDKTTDRVFFRDRYNTDDFYTRLNEALTSTTALRGLLQQVATEIGTTLKAEQAFFFVQYDSHHVSAGTKNHSLLPVADAEMLTKYTKKEGSDLLVTDLLEEDDEVYRLLVSHRIAIVMPLIRRGTVVGYLALGDHKGSGYTSRDTKVLRTVVRELVIAIQNALSVQAVKDLNAHLQQRIDAATRELQSSNARLRHLDTTKDEFLSMASHQLRTPLTSVKGYLSMVLEGDAGKITDMQRHLLTEAFVSSERMVHLIHDFLNVSRLQTGKFTLERHPADLKKLVANEVKSLRRVAETRGIKIKYTSRGDLSEMMIDESKIQQVVMNYIDNAIYYSHDVARPIEVTLEKVDNSVELRVIDSGIGVPKAEQEQLFSRFYRASNARKQRPDGTGVGIYLARKVVAAHGGEIIFSSQEGKGSTFGFRLPLDRVSIDSGK